MSSPDLSELSDFACDVAREAGKQILANLPLGRFGGDIEHKSGRELVSRVDRDSEKLIRRRVAQAFPGDALYGEEEGEAEAPGAERRWIVDPLDGTTNFLHGLPLFAVSIGVQDVATKELLAGAVYVPYVDELFFGERGGGAYVNARSTRLSASQCGTLDEALCVTGFAYDRERWPNYDNFVRVAKAARGIRRSGSAAIDLAFVAAGRCDAFWELGLRSHDVAAGALLVMEAGGRVGDFAGGDGWLDGGNIIAASPALFDAVAALLDPVVPAGT